VFSGIIGPEFKLSFLPQRHSGLFAGMSHLSILRTYAQKDPVTIPSSILFSHTSTSLTIYDAFPKSMFHFLILPRATENVAASDLASLRSILKGDKSYAKEVINALAEEAKILRKEIEGEMLKRYGFKWGIWTGFHAVPSMEYASFNHHEFSKVTYLCVGIYISMCYLQICVPHG
jgi:hypothetical protein